MLSLTFIWPIYCKEDTPAFTGSQYFIQSLEIMLFVCPCTCTPRLIIFANAHSCLKFIKMHESAIPVEAMMYLDPLHIDLRTGLLQGRVMALCEHGTRCRVLR